VPVRQIQETVGNPREPRQQLNGSRVSWSLILEDVLPAVHPVEIKAVSEQTTIPIIGTEKLMTRWQLRD
jgi:hypothetical protein